MRDYWHRLNLWWRIKTLCTGRVTWEPAGNCEGPMDWDDEFENEVLLPQPEWWVHDVDCTECVPREEHMRVRVRWRLFGPKSYNWWWVKRWGKMECGCCTRNPLTRRQVLYSWKCVKNSGRWSGR